MKADLVTAFTEAQQGDKSMERTFYVGKAKLGQTKRTKNICTLSIP